MAEVNPSFSVITLNINGINSPIKRPRLAVWIKKNPKIYTYTAYKRLTLDNMDIKRLKVKGWKKIFHTNSNQKRVGMAVS